MFGLGVILIAVGILCAVLPLFGREFMSALFGGASEFGSTLTGILLFGIGFALVLAERRRRRQRRLNGASAPIRK